jgi:hypothetical protein
MVAAVAGLGSVLAAYSDVLPSPIQQLAHVAFAAPTPPGSGPHHSGTQSGTQRTGHQVQRPFRSASQPAATGPPQSAGAAPSSGPARSSLPWFRPKASPSPGRGGTNEGCGPSLRQPTAPPSKRSVPPGPPYHCGGIPTGPSALPTLNPYAP